MRKMKEEEIWKLFNHITWGTLCGVQPGGEPYAIEFTTFLDDEEICAIINPRGTMAECVRHQPRVCLKVCESSRLSRGFRAASFFGTARFDMPEEPRAMIRAWEQLEERMQAPDAFSRAKKKYGSADNMLPVFRMRVDRISGVTSRPQSEEEEGKKA